MKKILGCLFLLLWCLVSAEELVYNVKILGISAGTQRMITKEEEGGIMIITHTKTNKFFSRFYKLDDEIETLMDKETFLPIIIKEKMEEGKERKDVITYLDQDKLSATIIEKDKRSQINLLNKTFNIPSLIHLLRNKKLKLGDKERFSIITLGKIEDVDLVVESLEGIYFNGKREDVFKVSTKDVNLWFSKQTNLPLIIEVKLKCGLNLQGILKR